MIASLHDVSETAARCERVAFQLRPRSVAPSLTSFDCACLEKCAATKNEEAQWLVVQFEEFDGRAI